MNINWNTNVSAPCAGEIVADDGRSILIQTDWGYPGTAQTFGWSLRSVQPYKADPDFDWAAECGIHVCEECQIAYYPMELEAGRCPDCDGPTHPYKPCDHDSTDGTVPCKGCGLTATDFISAAYDWLRDNDGAVVPDPGYFGEEE